MELVQLGGTSLHAEAAGEEYWAMLWWGVVNGGGVKKVCFNFVVFFVFFVFATLFVLYCISFAGCSQQRLVGQHKTP